MSVDFVQGQRLSQMSADALNRIASGVRNARSTPFSPGMQSYDAAPNMLLGVNNTSTTLYHGSIVAIDGSVQEGGGPISRRAPRAADLGPVTSTRHLVFKLVIPEYPGPVEAPEDPEEGEEPVEVWPYPEQRIGVVHTSYPIPPGGAAWVAKYGWEFVYVKFNDDYTDYATFIDGKTEGVQSCDNGPMRIVAQTGKTQGEYRECAVEFVVGPITMPTSGSGGGTVPGQSNPVVSLGRVISRDTNTGKALVQPLYIDENGNYQTFGEQVEVYWLRRQ